MAEPITQINTLLAPRFLFRFATPLKRYQQPKPKKKAKPGAKPKGVFDLELDESYRLPDLAALDGFTPVGERRFADVRLAWAPEGLVLQVEVTGKSQPVWCRDGRLEDSDGVQLWIDTRATHNVHRATKFCSRFGVLPSGGGSSATEAIIDQMLINRARENARPVRARLLQAGAKVTKDGYLLKAYLPSAALDGYDPEQHTRLGFTYAVVDRELGTQTFANGASFPYDEDPSCWATLELDGA
ncbi:hypothetical protein [Pseudobythopirellula maris]|nr:hypothetical protein [Pseudobythopirellula maris]